MDEKRLLESFLRTRGDLSSHQTRVEAAGVTNSYYPPPSQVLSHTPLRYYPPGWGDPFVAPNAMYNPPSIQQFPRMDGNNFNAFLHAGGGPRPMMHPSPSNLLPASAVRYYAPRLQSKKSVTDDMLGSMLEMVLPDQEDTDEGTPGSNDEDEDTIVADAPQSLSLEAPGLRTIMAGEPSAVFQQSLTAAIDASARLPTATNNDEQIQWMEMLEKLIDYKNTSGDCDIPPGYSEDPQLAEWVRELPLQTSWKLTRLQVAEQREQYKRLMDGFPSSLTSSRVHLLNVLGLNWNQNEAVGHSQQIGAPKDDDHVLFGDPEEPPVGPEEAWEPEPVKSTHEDKWWERFAELKEYKKETGHCIVPKNYPKNTELGHWVHEQRALLRRVENYDPTPLGKAQIELLQAIGLPPASKDPSWMDRFHELKEFKKETGHCNVPTRYSKNLMLGKWVNDQRVDFRRLQEGKPTKTGLTKERIDFLDSICFTWAPEPRESTFEAKWMERFHQLKEFKKENGHCNVPFGHSKNLRLGHWVQRQRDLLRKVHNGETNVLSQKRIALLNSIGFVMDARRDTSQAKWLELFGELKEFKKETGHCNVPDKYPKNPRLGNWSCLQRGDYRRRNRGEPTYTYLSQERIDMLNSIGFVWERKRLPDEAMWPDRYRELQDFKKKTGHCNVPEKYPENKPLGVWVKRQKTQLRNLYTGEPTNLTKEQIDMLHEVGLIWL